MTFFLICQTFNNIFPSNVKQHGGEVKRRELRSHKFLILSFIVFQRLLSAHFPSCHFHNFLFWVPLNCRGAEEKAQSLDRRRAHLTWFRWKDDGSEVVRFEIVTKDNPKISRLLLLLLLCFRELWRNQNLSMQITFSAHSRPVSFRYQFQFPIVIYLSDLKCLTELNSDGGLVSEHESIQRLCVSRPEILNIERLSEVKRNWCRRICTIIKVIRENKTQDDVE